MLCCRHLGTLLIVAATMMAAALGGCDNAVPDKPVVSAKPATSTAPQPRLTLEPASRISAAVPPQYVVPVSAEVALWRDGVDQNLDPHMRLAALEVWAGGPRESLDPVTYALVDPDESVRARAEELLEQELARR
jgi:hypothetical protein